jgi:hypothetical protein
MISLVSSFRPTNSNDFPISYPLDSILIEYLENQWRTGSEGGTWRHVSGVSRTDVRTVSEGDEYRVAVSGFKECVPVVENDAEKAKRLREIALENID